VRRFRYLTKLELPPGSLDLGKNTPAQTMTMVAPTVELLARPGLHPALSDLLIQAAQEVHGRATLLQKAGEFPAPLEHEYRVSEDAMRYYKSGKTFAYRHLPFWLASLVDRVAIVLVPLAVLLIPGLRIVPWLYKWRINQRIYRRYGELMALERAAFGQTTPEQRAELLKRLDEIEKRIVTVKLPASFADQLYVLRQHLHFVRNQIVQPGDRRGVSSTPIRAGGLTMPASSTRKRRRLVRRRKAPETSPICSNRSPIFQCSGCRMTRRRRTTGERCRPPHVYCITSTRQELPAEYRCDASLLARCPDLLAVSTSGAGYDTVDAAAATAAGVLRGQPVGRQRRRRRRARARHAAVARQEHPPDRPLAALGRAPVARTVQRARTPPAGAWALVGIRQTPGGARPHVRPGASDEGARMRSLPDGGRDPGARRNEGGPRDASRRVALRIDPLSLTATRPGT
jgi:hypothetical protein